MYSARTLLVPVLLMGGLMEVASAQHKYIFPQLKLPHFCGQFTAFESSHI